MINQSTRREELKAIDETVDRLIEAFSPIMNTLSPSGILRVATTSHIVSISALLCMYQDIDVDVYLQQLILRIKKDCNRARALHQQNANKSMTIN